MNWKSVALVLTGVVLGCAGGTASMAAAKVYAPQNPRFEQMCMGPHSMADANDDVERASRQGWELVAASSANPGTIVCFKRPL
jgi:hypothetical protein